MKKVLSGFDVKVVRRCIPTEYRDLSIDIGGPPTAVMVSRGYIRLD